MVLAWCSSWPTVKSWCLFVVGSSSTGRTGVSSPFKFPAWDLFLGDQELLWRSSWLEMPCPCCVMNRKGRGLPWLRSGGGGLEMCSKLECVLEPGIWEAALAESTSLRTPVCSRSLRAVTAPAAAGLWHSMHQCVLAHRHGASQTIALGPWSCPAMGTAAVPSLAGSAVTLGHPRACKWKATE